MLFKQALEESLKPESLLQIVQNFTPPMSSWSWNLEQLSLHESITEFRYRIRPITTKPQSESTSRPTETGMWGYLKTIATTTSSAAYRAATAAKDYAIDQMSERTLVGKLTVEPFSCPAPLEPKGYRLGVDLMASDVFTHNFVEKAYILLCFREIKYPSHAVDINLHLQMLAKPGILFGQLNSSKIEEFGESFSKAWLEALVDAANLKETAISRETNTNLGP
jgi:hypothetical protein